MTTGQQIGLMSNWQTYTFYHPQNTGKPRLYFAQQDTFLVVLVYCSCIKWHVFGSVCIAFRFACLKHLHLYIGQWYQRSLIKTSTLVHYTRGLSLVNEITFDRFSSPRWPVGDLPWSPVCTRNIISGQEHFLWPHHVKPPADLTYQVGMSLALLWPHSQASTPSFCGLQYKKRGEGLEGFMPLLTSRTVASHGRSSSNRTRRTNWT